MIKQWTAELCYQMAKRLPLSPVSQLKQQSWDQDSICWGAGHILHRTVWELSAKPCGETQHQADTKSSIPQPETTGGASRSSMASERDLCTGGTNLSFDLHQCQLWHGPACINETMQVLVAVRPKYNIARCQTWYSWHYSYQHYRNYGQHSMEQKTG
jgi:hypothetical protein